MQFLDETSARVNTTAINLMSFASDPKFIARKQNTFCTLHLPTCYKEVKGTLLSLNFACELLANALQF